jgi:hypothetical protein
MVHYFLFYLVKISKRHVKKHVKEKRAIKVF